MDHPSDLVNIKLVAIVGIKMTQKGNVRYLRYTDAASQVPNVSSYLAGSLSQQDLKYGLLTKLSAAQCADQFQQTAHARPSSKQQQQYIRELRQLRHVQVIGKSL